MNTWRGQLVAEVKTESPFGFRSSHSWNELFRMASVIGDIVSIHTDPRWGGSFDLLKQARSRTDKPLLAKGEHKTDRELELVLRHADWALCVGRIPPAELISRCWIEPLTLEELQRLPECRAVWNQRDLRTGLPKRETFKEARRLWSGWLCQASFIQFRKDIHPESEAALIGEHLVQIATEL